MIHLKIDHIDIKVPEGTTVLEAARQAGISIPTMCYLNGHGNHPSCMLCLVRDNRTNALVTSCALTVTQGMEITATHPDITTARRQALELLMSDHVGDCEAPCSLACPAGMDIPEMNRLIGEGRFSDALKVVKDEIALPYILGYICPAPCEKACRRKQVDEAVSVCLLKRFSAESGSAFEPALPEPSGKTVAVIGSGPAGLAAAYYLRLYGHGCHIYEKSASAGGTLRKDIPEEELPRQVIDQEVGIIRSLGVEFHFNALVTESVYQSELKGKYDAVIVATGDMASDNALSHLLTASKTGYQTDEKSMSSTLPGVFICGSAIRPHKMAVRSVAQGKTAAESVHHYLQDIPWTKPGKTFNSRFDKLLQIEFDEYLKESNRNERFAPERGYLGGFTREEAMAEALRCMHCDCRKKDNCRLRDYSHEYSVERKHYLVNDRKAMTKEIQHNQVIYEPAKCIKCGLCIDISAAQGERYGLAFEGRGFDVLVNVPLGALFHEGLSHAAEMCAEACPTGALSLKDRSRNSNSGGNPVKSTS